MSNKIFPFSAIVGQEQLKTALLLCAIDPTLGGVLIRGDKGAAKSTAARALVNILPDIKHTKGCAFNCLPEKPCQHCEICLSDNSLVQTTAVPFVTLPLGATEDRVIGTLDIELALQGKTRAFQPGLLANAHRGILYIDEVNLLQDHLVDVLLDAAAMGVNTVQREGLSITHPARFTLIGTMNIEEGDLRPQLLDRFGLMVEVSAPQDKNLRTEIVRRRIQFETNSDKFTEQWSQYEEQLRQQLIEAQNNLSEIKLSDELLDLIIHICCEFEIASLRADIVMHKASRALAALNNRLEVSHDDVKKVAELVLPHRRRRKPFEQPGLDQQQLDDLIQQSSQSEAFQNEKPPFQESDNLDQANDNKQPTNNSPEDLSEVFSATDIRQIRQINVTSTLQQNISGKRSKNLSVNKGQTTRTVANESPEQLAVSATLRSAAIRNPDNFQVTKKDLHQRIQQGKAGNLIILVVDASGSMAAQRRMETVKGSVLALLTDAYQKRDQVAVIAFRGNQAEILLSPTHSVELAEQSLQELATGGRTPLPHALYLTLDLLSKQNNNMQPLLVFLTDGKANISFTKNADPWLETLKFADLIAQQHYSSLVVDTETGYLRLGRAKQLAREIMAEYLTLEELSAENLTITIRNQLKGGMT
jgi:magnesium chelatase subunit D